MHEKPAERRVFSFGLPKTFHAVIPAKAGIHWLSRKGQNGFPLLRE
jgi:hypothetical protein